MLKPHALAAALLLAGAIGPARAEATFYYYDIRHLLGTYSPPVAPTWQQDFLGVFAGEDLDHDGVIRLPEVSAFYIGLPGGAQLWPPVCTPIPGSPGCDMSQLDAFHYTLGSNDFEAAGRTGGSLRDWVSIETGVALVFQGAPGQPRVEYRWTPETVLTVRPVPEPATAGLLALGLGMLGCAARGARARRLQAGKTSSPCAAEATAGPRVLPEAV